MNGWMLIFFISMYYFHSQLFSFAFAKNNDKKEIITDDDDDDDDDEEKRKIYIKN